MKKNVQLILTLFIFTSINQIEAQNRFIARQATLSEQDHLKIEESLEEYEILTFDFVDINRLVKKNDKDIRLDLKISKDVDLELLLEENDLRSIDYKGIFTTDDGITEDNFQCNTYKGHIANSPSEKVRLTINKDELKGYIQLEDDYLFLENVSSFVDHRSEEMKLVAYRQSAIKLDPKKVCGVSALLESDYLKRASAWGVTQQATAIPGEEHWVVEVATEADAEWFDTFGANSNQEILGELNLVEGVYEDAFNMYFLVVFQNVWTNINTDPYASFNGNGIIDELTNEWENNRENVHRDLVLHFTDKDLGGLLGQAAGIGTLCSVPEDSYAFNTNYFATFYTVAHEIGHTLGGIHGDGQNCGGNNRTIMCQGDTTNNFVFSNASETRIGNYLDANGWDCLRGYIAVSGGHERVCDDRLTIFTLFDTNTPNTTVTWQTSSNLTVNGNSGNSIYVKATVSGSSTGWVQFTITSNTTGEQIQVRKDNIPIGPEPANFTISSFPSCASVNQVVTLVANITGVSYNWVVNGGTLLSGQGSQSINARMGSGGFMAVHCSVSGTEDCGGPLGTASTFIGSCFGFSSADSAVSIFPNPASDILNVELINEPADKSFSLEILNEFGVLVKQVASRTGAVTKINTEGLKDGIYYLKIIHQKGILVRRIFIQRS
ncbi:MAG: hypothetical protein DHS20C17_17860 [Cyclobacteriaceae bacterium]|nr:MAG: hypothetical protein DHS20C17_17860 [Cyclobacteriaceae bacterium]